MAHVLFTFVCVCLRIVVSNTYCVVFFFVLCTLCCQFLQIVYFCLPLRYSLTFMYSPNITRNMPPTTGSGMVTNSAPNLPKQPSTIIIIPPTCITIRLPTLKSMSYVKQYVLIIMYWKHYPCRVYSIQHYVIKFVSDLRQVGGFPRVLQFPAQIKLIVTI